MKSKIIKILVIAVFLLIPTFFLLPTARGMADVQAADAVSGSNPYASLSGSYGGGIYGGLPLLGEITEEQRQTMDRLLVMPTGKMNPELWAKILGRLSCFIETKQLVDNKVSDAVMADIARTYGVTGEEFMAYYVQMMSGKLDTSALESYPEGALLELFNKEFEASKKINCKLAAGAGAIGESGATSTAVMTEDVWFEITARIRCIDRTLFILTRYEIGTIFTPFGVTAAEYSVYSDGMLKKMDELTKKDANLWTKDDPVFGEKLSQFKARIETLKKNNCVLENGKKISEEYLSTSTEPVGWEKTKCKLFSCDSCYNVTETSSFWAKYRCKTLCEGCPIVIPPPPPVTNCAGFCSMGGCPSYADKVVSGNTTCAPQKVCTRCGLFKLFNCCEEREAICCRTRPADNCQNQEGSCGLKQCSNGTESVGSKDCPSGKEKYKCGPFGWFTCKRNVGGVCCVKK
jgi:hypothetical protein